MINEQYGRTCVHCPKVSP